MNSAQSLQEIEKKHVPIYLTRPVTLIPKPAKGNTKKEAKDQCPSWISMQKSSIKYYQVDQSHICVHIL
jgi:hypothetical protein